MAIPNCHKRELNAFFLETEFFKIFELWFLSQYAKRYIKPGQSLFNFNAWTFSCEDLFAKQIFHYHIYNLGNRLLTLLPITSFLQQSNCPIAFRNTIKMPTEILCLQLRISQFFHDIKCSNLAYFKNVKTRNETIFL